MLPAMMTRTFPLLVLSLTLFACAAPTAVGYAPGTSATERDRLHRTTPTPQVEPIEELTATTVTADFDAPLTYMTQWFTDLDLTQVMTGTDELPAVTGTVMLSDGPWGAVGSRRRVALSDNSTALEQIVEAQLPGRVRYVVWNYTSDAASYVEYGVGEFRFEAVGDKTRVNWTYGFSARGWPASWFIGDFVNGDYRDMMVVSLKQMKDSAELSWQNAQHHNDTPIASR